MKTTYKKIAETQDVFRRLSEMPLTVLDAESLKQGIVELDKFYGQLDDFKKEFHTREDYEKEFNNFIETEIELECFPINIRDESGIRITALDLLRIEGFINFTG